MSNFAILVTGESASPRVVRLDGEGVRLNLIAGDGTTDAVPWWRLYRVANDGTVDRFRRLDRKAWELRVTTGADRALLAHVGKRPFHRFIQPFRRLESAKVIIGVAVLSLTVMQHAPAEWLSGTFPEWAQARLMDNFIAEDAPLRCNHEGGEAAVRKLLVRLDPTLGDSVDIVAIRNGGFIVSSTPGDHIFMFRSSMAEIDPQALPALLAHELSHIRHGDTMTAVVRQRGFLGTWAAVLDGNRDRQMHMQFSGLEERRADLEAMQEMRRAGMPLKPAADMFEQVRISKEQGGFFGYDQRDFHFGIDNRAKRWAVAAQADPPNPMPVLSDAEEDALYNFCWSGPIPPLPKGARRAPENPRPPGTGSLPLPNDGRS